MNTELKEMINAIWDAVADRAPGEEGGYYDPDAVVARALSIPKWKAVEARRGYRRQRKRHTPSLAKVSIQQRPFLDGAHA